MDVKENGDKSDNEEPVEKTKSGIYGISLCIQYVCINVEKPSRILVPFSTNFKCIFQRRA